MDNVRRYNLFRDGKDRGYLALQRTLKGQGVKGIAAGVISFCLLAWSGYLGLGEGWRYLLAALAIGGYGVTCFVEALVLQSTLHLMDWIDVSGAAGAANHPDTDLE